MLAPIPVPTNDVDGSPLGRQYDGDAFTLFVGDDGLIDLYVEDGKGLTLGDLQQLRATLDQVLPGGTAAEA